MFFITPFLANSYKYYSPNKPVFLKIFDKNLKIIVDKMWLYCNNSLV